MNLMGSPETPIQMKEARIEYVPRMAHQEEDYPVYLREVIPYLVTRYLQTHNDSGRITDNSLPRLCGYTQDGEGLNDERGNITLRFDQTTYHQFLATNRSLDHAAIPSSLGSNRTIREAYVSFPYILEQSVLANPLSANVVVISRNLNQEPHDQVIIRFRSEKVALYRSCFQVSAAGYVNLEAHKDTEGLPNPFVTAVVEARQEIADNLILSPSDFKMLGIAVRWDDLDLNLYGHVETGLAISELRGSTRRDDFEGAIDAIPFTPRDVLRHIGQNNWEPVSVLNMCNTLLAYFDRAEVEAEARRIPARGWRSFLETPVGSKDGIRH